MKRKVDLSTYSIIVSIIGIAVLVAVMVYELKTGHEVATYFVASFLVVLCALALIYCPMSVSVDENNLAVNFSLRFKSIRLADMESVELCTPTMNEKRLLGSGGWFGYWGRFYEPSIGKYFAYYGKASDCFLVKLKDGRQYLLGCHNPAQMVNYIKSLLTAKRAVS